MNAVQFSNYCVQELLASYAPVACCLCIEQNPVYRKKPHGNTKTCHNLYYNFFLYQTSPNMEHCVNQISYIRVPYGGTK